MIEGLMHPTPNVWVKLNGGENSCVACDQPYSRALGIFLHKPECPAFDPTEHGPPRNAKRAHRWRNARREGRWTPVRARLFRVYLLRNWRPYLKLWCTFDLWHFWFRHVGSRRPKYRKVYRAMWRDLWREETP